MSDNGKNKELLHNKLSQVNEFLENEAIDSALDILLELLEEFDKEPEIYKSLGWIAFKKVKLNEAEVYFQKALELDNKNPDYCYNLGWLYFYNNKLDLSETYYLKTIELEPEYPFPYINIGAINYEIKNYERALEYYLIAKSLDPSNTHLLNNLGDTYYKLKDYNSAIKTYQNAINLEPDNSRAYGNIALVYNEIGQTQIAEELCRKAIAFNPQSVNGHYNLASFLYEKKLYQEAYDEIIQAKSLSKHLNQHIFTLLVKIKKQLGINYDEELDILDKLLDDDPLYYHIVEQNHYKVLDILLERLEEDILNYFYLSQLGYTLSQFGRYDKAIEIFEMAIKLNDTEAWTNQHYAFALSQYNKKEEAIKYYKKAIKLAPMLLWPKKQLVELLIQINRPEEALDIINDTLLYINGTENKESLSELFSLKAQLLTKDNIDEAIDWYMLAISYNNYESYNYERVSSLLSTKFTDKLTVVKNIKELFSLTENDTSIYYCNNALAYQRSGNVHESITYYKKALDSDINYYPAYTGIAQALYEKRYTTISIKDNAKIYDSNLVKNWNKLTSNEQFIINYSIKPFKHYVDKIINSGGYIIIMPLETKITTYPENKYLAGEFYYDGTPYQGIRALGGLRVYIGIERLRDLLWKVPGWLKQVPASFAHEFAHQVYEVLEERTVEEINGLYKETLDNSYSLVSDYSALNVQEFFAENYSFFVRQKLHSGQIQLQSPVLELIQNLSYNF
ncbi:MAG: tetratricopeptide repeat protein [Cyanobacteriota bacterium]